MFLISKPIFIFVLLPIAFCAAIWRYFFYKKVTYIFSSFIPLQDIKKSSSIWPEKMLFLLRLISILSLIAALARITTPDEKSKIPVKGIDIMLVLDVSDSMNAFDDLKDRRSRISVAKTQALNFIKKRENDPIGLVLFAKGVLTRCPLTLDKNILSKLLQETDIGILNPDGTYLSWAIISAANRLKESDAKSKIMIVLTDGAPSAEDVDPKVAVDLVKKLGIKIYTIGIGSESGGYREHPLFREPFPVGQNLNTSLLKQFAQETGGQFFLAQKPDDMEKIYQIIDQLEKTQYEKPVYSRYFEFFPYFLLISLLAILMYILLSSLVWISL